MKLTDEVHYTPQGVASKVIVENASGMAIEMALEKGASIGTHTAEADVLVQILEGLWAKDAAPSTALREWYHQDREDRWPEFQKKYRAELAVNPAIPELLSEIRRHPLVTILYGSKDPAHNQAVILADYLREHL